MKQLSKKIFLIVQLTYLTSWASIVQAVGSNQFENPLGQNVTVTVFLARVTNWLLGIVGFLVMLALVYGGIKYIISFGDEAKVKEGKQIIYWALAGLVVVILSYVIIKLLQDFLGVA